MATIHKRRLRSGELVWELTHGTGKDRQRLVAGKTREEAQAVLNQFNRQLALHGDAPSGDDLDNVLGRYTAFLKTNRRYGTQRRYVRVLQTFHDCYLRAHQPQIKTLRQLRPVHIEDYKNRRIDGSIVEVADPEVGRRETELRQSLQTSSPTHTWRDNARFGWLGRKKLRPAVSPRTVNYELQVLSTYFRWAITRNVLFINPTTTVERFRVSKQALPKFLTSEQLKKLFAACSERERRLFMTILLTGMRRGEAVHLTWADVNFELGVIFIQAKPEWDWKPKTDERIIPISPTLSEVLQQHHALRRSDGLVFPNKEGNRDIHILPKLKKVARRAGLPHATVHALRHSFGAHLRMAGVSLADIADLMGHKDLATTQIYAKVQQEHLRKEVAKLAPLAPDNTPEERTVRLLPESTPKDKDQGS
ncbi:MAG TPA: tyrosine-type recombinase/integrase [Vicinamibacterales bacterium]|nr:tyrosine-type recombinase/integrase [Vicinamibacterales bacterium]